MHYCVELRDATINCHAEQAPRRPEWDTVQILYRITFTGFMALHVVQLTPVFQHWAQTSMFATDRKLNEWITEALLMR